MGARASYVARILCYNRKGEIERKPLKAVSEVAAAQGPEVTKGSFLVGAHRKLSVALI